MKSLLLAAGLGTRLRPFTFYQAKASLPLMNLPFIHYPLQYLFTNQAEEVVINLHAHPDTVRKAAGSDYRGIKISYSEEPEILGTAGAIRKASGLLGEEPFAVINADSLSYIPLQEVLDQHVREGADVTLVVMKEKQFSNYSSLFFEEPESGPQRLSGIGQGMTEAYHYTGVQVVSPSVSELIPENRKLDIFRDIYPQLIPQRRIHGFLYDGFWMDIGTLKDYLNTSLELIRQPLPLALQPPEMQYSLVSPQATIEEGAEATDSIVMSGAVIPSGSRVHHCIVGWDVTVKGLYRYAALARGMLPWYIFNERAQ